MKGERKTTQSSDITILYLRTKQYYIINNKKNIRKNTENPTGHIRVTNKKRVDHFVMAQTHKKTEGLRKYTGRFIRKREHVFFSERRFFTYGTPRIEK